MAWNLKDTERYKKKLVTLKTQHTRYGTYVAPKEDTDATNVDS